MSDAISRPVVILWGREAKGERDCTSMRQQANTNCTFGLIGKFRVLGKGKSSGLHFEGRGCWAGGGRRRC